MGKEDGESSNNDMGIGSTHYFQCPLLTTTNYTIWLIRMKIILQANGLRKMVESDRSTADEKRDKTAIGYLFQGLPKDMILQVASCTNAKEVWDTLKTRNVGVDRVQKAKLQTLKSEFEMLQMEEDETIDSFTAKMTSLTSQMTSLGSTLDDATRVRHLLNSVPERFIQIVASIEQYSDLDKLTLDEAIGRLKTFEERIKIKQGKIFDHQDKLLFTRHDNNGQRHSYDKKKKRKICSTK
uniref:uncharacterized protein LOC122604415 n=1 Tax=Erigeron canadensis TaxID=72917 RepID=UPI001CB8F384|nr:uncharacterized protein LOC122604415 [Erigeron canadensis]